MDSISHPDWLLGGLSLHTPSRSMKTLLWHRALRDPLGPSATFSHCHLERHYPEMTWIFKSIEWVSVKKKKSINDDKFLSWYSPVLEISDWIDMEAVGKCSYHLYNLILIGCSWCICSNQQSIRGMIATPGHSPQALLKECMGQKTSLMSEKVF